MFKKKNKKIKNLIDNYFSKATKIQEKEILIKKFENKYPFFKESNQIQKWEELIQYFLSKNNVPYKESHLRIYEEVIKNFSDLCYYSKPLSSLTPINNKIYILNEQKYAIFKGYSHTSSQSPLPNGRGLNREVLE